MTYLLDTCAFIKAAVQGESGLGNRAKRIIRDPRNRLILSAASLAELAYLMLRGRIEIGRAELKQGLADLQIEIIPLRESHVERCFGLPPAPKDPLDRMIIATALAENMPVLSSDGGFRLCRELEVIWD